MDGTAYIRGRGIPQQHDGHSYSVYEIVTDGGRLLCALYGGMSFSAAIMVCQAFNEEETFYNDFSYYELFKWVEPVLPEGYGLYRTQEKPWTLVLPPEVATSTGLRQEHQIPPMHMEDRDTENKYDVILAARDYLDYLGILKENT